jgi:hypothetical protein
MACQGSVKARFYSLSLETTIDKECMEMEQDTKIYAVKKIVEEE